MIACLGSLHGIQDVQLWLSQLLLQQQGWERALGPLEQEVSMEGLQRAKAGSLAAHCCVSESRQRFSELILILRTSESSQVAGTTPPSISGACCSDMLGCTDCAVMALCVEDR